MKIKYDSAADVLYITFEQSQDEVLYHENQQELIIRTNKITGSTVGVTIPHFFMRASKGEITISELE